ncbi:MAG: glycoside hydrolase family 13 protein [Ruminococcaceae bacterium]|nr:glycoside hydrolase family 13 protein [Oscillospiraceae bacterium]
MRILYDSKQLIHKNPFGTLVPGQECSLKIHIPSNVQATRVECMIQHPDGSAALTVRLEYQMKKGAYDIFGGKFAFEHTGLYFYWFRVTQRHGGFRLFKQGDHTNMEAGDLWQVSCVPADAAVPEWAQGGTMYQIFPDRFFRAGKCDLTGKLEPYTLHEDWYEDVHWQPKPDGRVLNNDFYGGNFRGIMERLDYLLSLGITVIYLNPISKSFSSHRYDTGDYKTPDPMLGTMADFTALCNAVHARGMRIILDGVYSHTGSDSLYFNRYGHFPGQGAYQSQQSPYAGWYSFSHWPDTYQSWWGFDTLPTVNKMDPAFLEYIITGQDSVIAHWLKAGCDGFRLDVADELPSEFLTLLRRRVRELKPDALVIGEVWEDASNKVAYGRHRQYFTDGQLDSVMNYPLRTAIINFLRERDDGYGLYNTVMTLAENYPPQVFLAAMNCLGTHDSPRILTALMDDFDGSREEKARRKLSLQQRLVAQERLLMASFLQYMLPGMPSLYYADETGMEGYRDPFNRRTYPWGREDRELLTHHKMLGKLRKDHKALRLGDIQFFQAGDQRIGFSRSLEGKTYGIYANRGHDNWEIPGGKVLLGHNLYSVAPEWTVLSPMGFCIVEEA